MNSKAANVIAIELGILIVILAWLAYARLPAFSQPKVAEEQERTAGVFAAVAPVLKVRDQCRSAAEYRADHETEEQEEEEQAPTDRQYDQEIATAPSTASDLRNDVTVGSLPYYAGVDQEPVTYPPDYLASPLDQIVEYPQPNEIIVFSNVRSFGHRFRLTAHFCDRRMIVPHRCPVGGEHPARGVRLVSRQNPNARSFRQSPALRPR